MSTASKSKVRGKGRVRRVVEDPYSRLAMPEKRGTPTFMVPPEKLLVIGWNTKHKSKQEHPLFQKRALEPVDEGLALAIATNGFQSVISVRIDGDKYEVDDGRRRSKAAVRANEIRKQWAKEAKERGEEYILIPILVECKVVKGTTLAHIGRMISANSYRDDVDPMQMAEDLADYMSRGATEEMAAMACGREIPDLRKTLTLLNLHDDLQEAVRSGVIPMKAGIYLAKLGRDDQLVEYAKIKKGDAGATVADVEAAVRSKKKGEEITKAPGKRMVNWLLENEDGKKVLQAADGAEVARWMLGELNARNIKGLVEAVRLFENRKAEPKK